MNNEIDELKQINMRLSLILGMAYGMLINVEAYTDTNNMEWLTKQIEQIFYE